LRYEQARRGRNFHIQDALIAATAITIAAARVTDNVRDIPMPELKHMRFGGSSTLRRV
jgi:predicted nucleic acid-binding protein